MTDVSWWMRKKRPLSCTTSGNRYATPMGFMDVASFKKTKLDPC